jgi:hypothetical protein
MKLSRKLPAKAVVVVAVEDVGSLFDLVVGRSVF